MLKIGDLLESLAKGEEYTPSYHPNIEFYRSSKSIKRNCLIYDSSIIIVGKGEKELYLKGEKIIYNPDNFLILSTPMQFECATELGSNNSFLALKIKISIETIRKILHKIKKDNVNLIEKKGSNNFVHSINMNENIKNITVRLLQTLKSEEDSNFLADNLLQELLYMILKDKKAKSLFELTYQNNNFSNIAKVISHIHDNYYTNISVTGLATISHMNEASFYRIFKDITGFSPIQYIKSLRLGKAKEAIMYRKLSIKEAASEVGYQSVSQFSREFKRMYNKSPSDFN